MPVNRHPGGQGVYALISGVFFLGTDEGRPPLGRMGRFFLLPTRRRGRTDKLSFVCASKKTENTKMEEAFLRPKRPNWRCDHTPELR